MPIKVSIIADSADELAEGLRKHAQERDGKFVVDSLPEGFAVEDVKGLRNTVQAERQARKEAEALLKPYLEAGIAADDVASAVDALQMMKAGKLKSAEALDAWKAEVLKKHNDELAKRDALLGRRTQTLRDQIVRGRLSPIIAAKGGSEAMDAILTLAEKRIQVQEDAEGNLVPLVVGDDGRTPLVTKKVGSTDPMGFDELIDLMRESPGTKGLFKAQAAGGSGSSSQTTGGGRAAGMDGAKPLSARELMQRANESTTAGRAAG